MSPSCKSLSLRAIAPEKTHGCRRWMDFSLSRLRVILAMVILSFVFNIEGGKDTIFREKAKGNKEWGRDVSHTSVIIFSFRDCGIFYGFDLL